MFGKSLDGPAQVMLREPPPLGVPIEVRRREDGVDAVLDGKVLATARRGSVSVDRPALPDEAEVRAARARYEAQAGDHLLPHCFVCGTGRSEGDGLRIFAGPVAGSPVHADFWTPTDDLADADGFVAPEFLWAALDCPGYFALRSGGELCLLGRLTVDIHRCPRVGERLLCAAWAAGREGRKFFADSVLVDETGESLAAANAVWIQIGDPRMVEKIRLENR